MGQIQQGGGSLIHRADEKPRRPVTLPLEAILVEIEQRILNLHRFASERFDVFERKLERVNYSAEENKYQKLCDGYENALSVCDDAQRLVTLLRKLK